MDGDETIPPSGDPETDITRLIPLGGATTRPLADEPELDGYEDIRRAARGGMGVVYEATQSGLNRKVALKIMSAVSMADEKMRERFRLEAEAVAQLEHPHIVPIYDVGTWEDRPFIAMKWVEGTDLNRWMKRRLSQSPMFSELLHEAVGKLVKVAEAVHHAHQRGFLHRDLKPSNIMIGEDGTAFVTDFGLARRMGSTEELTLSGQVLGTPSFMSPEQARGDQTRMSVATDVFSLGAILYWALTGAPPFTGDSVMDILRKINDEEPARPSTVSAQTDRDLETIALKCLRKEPEERYASAEALAEELGRWLRGEPITARPATGLERARSFCRRKPIVAGLIAAVVVLTLTLIVHLALSSARLQTELAKTSGRLLVEEQQRQLAEKNRQTAVTQREYAVEQETIAKRERGIAIQAGQKLQDHLLRLQIRAAQQNLASGNTSRGLAELAALARAHPEIAPVRKLLAEELGVRSFAVRNNWRFEHPQAVTRLIYNQDGSRLITGCADGRIRFFDTAAGTALVLEIEVGPNPVNLLELANANTLLATASTNYVIVDLADQSVRQRGVKRGKTRPFKLSPDEKLLVTSEPGGIVMRTESNGVVIQKTKSRPAANDVWANDSSYYVSSGIWGQFHVFPANGHEVYSVELPAKTAVTRFITFPWSRNFMTVGHATKAVLWNPDTGEPVQELPHSSVVIAADLAPNSAKLATGDVAGYVHYWTGTNHVPQIAKSRCHGPIRFLSCSAAGNDVFAAAGDANGGEARIFEMGSGLTRVEGIHWQGLVACDSELRTAATLSESNIVVGWNLRASTNHIIFRASEGASAMTDLMLSEDKHTVAFSTANGITGALQTKGIDHSIGIANRFNIAPKIAIDRRSRHMIAYDSSKALRLTWNRKIYSVQNSRRVGPILHAAYNRNANGIVLISKRGTYDLDFKGNIRQWHKHGETFWGAYLPGPNQINVLAPNGVMGSHDADHYGKMVGAWKITPDVRLWRNRALSPDGRWFAGIDPADRLRLYPLGKNKHPEDLGRSRIASSFTFSPASDQLAIIDPVGDAKLIPLAEGSKEILISGRRFIQGVILDDEPILVTISRDRLLQFWDTASGLPVRASIQLPYQPLSLVSRGDGRMVFVGDQAGVRRISIPNVKAAAAADPNLPAIAENLAGLRLTEDGQFGSIGLDQTHRNLSQIRAGLESRN